MSDAENKEVENQRKGEPVDTASSDESQDVDKDSGSDKEHKVDVPRTKKEASKTPKKEKDKELLAKQKSKSSNKKENVNTNDESDSSDDKDVDDDDDDDDDDDEEEEEDGEKKLALLDQPLQISGARERKKVDRLSISFHVPNKDKKTDIPEGDGIKLGDIPIVDFRLQKFKSDDLKFLHKLLFNRPGQISEIKKNIRRFSGFTFKKDSPEFERKKNYVDKLTLTIVRQICEVLDLERSGTKEELNSRIMNFLLKPKSSDKKVPVSKSRKTRSSLANSRSEKSKSSSTKKSKTRSSSKKSKVKAVDDSKSESSNADAEEDEEEMASEEEKMKDVDKEEEEEDDDDENVEATESEEDKKKKKNSKKESKSKISSVKEENKKLNKKEEKREEKKSVPRVSNKKSKAELSDAESSDDEPLVKKAKQPPTDDELKVLVKKILEGANLEEITMKTVCKQVYAAYPDFDLSDRKEFIKSTVRSIIS